MNNDHERMAAHRSAAAIPLRPSGIGGWLVLPMLSLFFLPLISLATLGTNILPAFAPDVWPGLTTPESLYYSAVWAPLIMFEAAVSLVMVAAPMVLLVFFFRKKQIFPRLMIGLLLFTLVVDSAATFALMAQNPIWEIDELKVEIWRQLAQGSVGAAIWVPYFLRSRRVQNTFVR